MLFGQKFLTIYDIGILEGLVTCFYVCKLKFILASSIKFGLILKLKSQDLNSTILFYNVYGPCVNWEAFQQSTLQLLHYAYGRIILRGDLNFVIRVNEVQRLKSCNDPIYDELLDLIEKACQWMYDLQNILSPRRIIRQDRPLQKNDQIIS